MSAESVLGTADIAVRMRLVTNVLRHSSATYCDITLKRNSDHVDFTVINDNPAVTAATAPATHRATNRLGGQLDHGTTVDGRYQLTVNLPLMEPSVHSPT